ncbi:major facilitator superfamily domain-containing protein [Annulohypoxylon maeteangense]|uniref:major facilitator superfamily domain-containing protein n=1 Tax=Annulohypoxylon maeteangense TaxID=1927788 RepID=UPI002008BF67|nr:major facilitator superfamily domain-containing protein [Annulohypoxylon maeteangense]KAI0889177.1 major facilitator superfamily domain-containing protein [Annulohypoxylon maeteangense]
MALLSQGEKRIEPLDSDGKIEISSTPDERDISSISSGEQNEDIHYLVGWRFYLSTAGIGLGLFLINFEVTIVSTALVPITNELHDFQQASWVITAYLLTYTGGLVIWAKLSDIIGRKLACLSSMIIFTAFSAGCGAAQTLLQLIVCRAFQGIGGSGIYAVTIAMVYEMVPAHKLPIYSSFVMILFLIAVALGPLLGGIISQQASWRWIFLINVPFCAVAAAMILFSVPNNFPNQGRVRHPPRPSLKSLDFLGATLMLAALALLITGLQQGSSLLSWSDSSVLAPLIVSGVSWVAFLASQWYVSREGNTIQPVFPWRFCRSRLVMALLLNAFTIGGVGITCTIQLPFRSQTAVGMTPLESGVRLLAFSAAAPLGFVAMSIAVKKRRVPPIYLSLVAQVLQIIGLVFMSRAPVDKPDWATLYGVSSLVGFGMGACNSAATLMTPFMVEKRDIAVASASVVQFRFLGSTVVLSVITSVGNTWVKNRLSEALGSENLGLLFESTELIDSLPSDLETLVRNRFIESFNLQMEIVLGVAVVSVFTTLLMWQRPQIRIP